MSDTDVEPAARTPGDDADTRAVLGPRDEARLGVVLPLLVPVVFLAIVAWSRRWTFEDAFLNYRVVDQIRAGHGAVFNIGQRVEVTTSTLWLAVLLLLRSALPFVSIEMSSIVTCIVLSALGVWWAQRASLMFWRPDDSRRVAFPFGAVVFVALAASWDWSTSGLENGLSFAWLGATALVLAHMARERQRTWRSVVPAGVLVGLGPLVRPDLAIMSGVSILAIVWMRRHQRRLVLVFVLGCAALPVAVEILRMGYYAQLVPNTALAKAASSVYWQQGWRYLLDFLEPYWLAVPLVVSVVTAALLLRTERAAPVVAIVALPVAGVLHALYITRSGGDYVHGRLLLPSLFAFVTPFAAIWWSRRLLLPVAMIAVWGVVCIGWLRPVDVHERGLVILTKGGTNDARAQAQMLAKRHHRPVHATDFAVKDGQLARRLQREGRRALVAPPITPVLVDVTPARTTLVSESAGVSGYLAGPDVIVHEANALADLVGSHMSPLASSIAGHRKRETPTWIIALTTRPGISVGRDPGAVDAARQAVQCGELADLLHATAGSLGIQMFFTNLLHAPAWTGLEVPRSPRAAERRFCGTPSAAGGRAG